VVVLSEKEICLRFCIRVAVFLLTYSAPRLALQLAQAPTMADLSYGSDPASNSMQWSACVLGFFLHQWQMGSSCRTWARSSFHRLVLYIGLPLIVESIGQEILTPTPRRALDAVVVGCHGLRVWFVSPTI
jgi:hypothetical protein